MILFTRSEVTNDLLHYDASTGTSNVILDGGQLGLTNSGPSSSNRVNAIELFEEDTIIAGETFKAGEILISVESAATIEGVSAQVSDLVRLANITTGVGTTSAVADVVFQGSDFGFDAAHNWDALTILGEAADAPANEAPSFNGTLDEVVSYTEGQATVPALDTDATISDNELSMADDFGGATLTFERVGGGNPEDVFTPASGSSLDFSGTDVLLSGVSKGTFAVNNGTLTLTFAAGVTNADVNEILQSVGYRTSSSNPPASIDVQWTFNDGNTGAQGQGGALFARGTTTINFITVDTPPTGLSSGIEINNDGGNDTYLIANDGGAILGGATSLTFETTFSGTPSASTTPLISYAAGDAAGNDFYVQIEADGDLLLFVAGSNRTITGFDYSTLLDGDLHSLAVSWDNDFGSFAVFVDGQLESSGFLSRGSTIAGSAGNGELVFGNDQDSIGGDFEANQAFQGTFYDVRIWDSFRTEAEIQQFQNQKLDPANLPADLLANWQFDGFEGSEIVEVVSGNNLTVARASGTGFIASTPIVDLNIDEHSSNGTQVGYVIPTDSDANPPGSFTFNLVEDASGAFALDSSTGEITVANGSQLIFESNPSHDVTVEVTDAAGNTYDDVLTIVVNDVVNDRENTGPTFFVGDGDCNDRYRSKRHKQSI